MAGGRSYGPSPGDKTHRRHSTIEAIQNDPVQDRTDSTSSYSRAPPLMSPRSLGSPSRLRDSIVSMSAADGEAHDPRPLSPPTQLKPPRPQRFSMLRFRHASDPNLSKTAGKMASLVAPPIPPAPSIITTAPTIDNLVGNKNGKQLLSPPHTFNRMPLRSRGPKSESNRGGKSLEAARATFEESRRKGGVAPPPYGDESSSALALPVSRVSESSRSDGSLGENGVFASTTTTTHTVSTTTTFFRLPRRKKKNKGPLFPLPVKISPENSAPNATTPRHSTSGRPSDSPSRGGETAAVPRPSEADKARNRNLSPRLPTSPSSINATTLSLASPGSPVFRSDSNASGRSGRAQSVSAAPAGFPPRGRTSTMISLGDDSIPNPPIPQSTRTSTSTSGRGSLGGLFNLSKLRQSSEPMFARPGKSGSGMPGTPRSNDSKQNSFSLPREPPQVVPERQEGDTPAKYLARLEEAVSRGVVATLLSKSEDEFLKNVLRSYMRSFKFFEDPLDMAIRKLLMEAELPKETQQIDRVLQSFADRYHECNPGIFASPDEAYFIAFSILILHTDVFNKNNKHKMQKSEYCKNTRGQSIAEEILECFYDNILYTPFIHVEDDYDINGERIVAHKLRKPALNGTSSEGIRRTHKAPVDPYTLILDNKLDTLRPIFKDGMHDEDPFSYRGTAASFNLADLQRTFFKSGVIQIMSSRSRPEAFMTQATTSNPAEAPAGVVDIKVTKVGVLWRKDPKKKKARSPWQEWGAILTGAQLYFFRNASWVKNLMHQYDQHQRTGTSGTPVIFKPPLEQFKPDFLLSTEDVVALLDANYKKHKHAFVFVRYGGFEETFLADNEAEMNDWLAKLNFAAAFRTAGVRMRGVVGGSNESHRNRGIRGVESSNAESIQGPSSEVVVQKGRFDHELAQQISMARRQIVIQKISEADEKMAHASKQLDMQLRNSRHLQILTPIQNKTREEVVLAGSRMATNIRWARMELWRMRCHKEILSMDLDDEIKSGSSTDRQRSTKVQRTSQQSSTLSPREDGLSRMSSQTSHVSGSPSKTRDNRSGTQPGDARIFNINEIFQTPTRVPSSHKPQGSWELPPLAFHEALSPTNPGFANTRHKDEDATSDRFITELTTPNVGPDDDEHKVLQEAGIVSPSSSTPDHKPIATVSEEDESKPVDFGPGTPDGRPKVRHSLQRKLRDAHVPTHHRSKKGKDSSGSGTPGEDTSLHAEGEGLARSAGSFTVHGKKASVINFGSEWHNMSPEERIKLRKQALGDNPQLSVPMAVADEAGSVLFTSVPEGRPVSAMSGSTTTGKSMNINTNSNPAPLEQQQNHQQPQPQPQEQRSQAQSSPQKTSLQTSSPQCAAQEEKIDPVCDIQPL